MNVPILMYHRVCDDALATSSPFVVTRSVFARQLEWLASRGYRTRTVADLARLGDVPAAERTVLLTFDDGYLDNYTNAFPLLRAHAFTATLFVVADFQRRFDFWARTGAGCRVPLLEKQHMREMAGAGIHFGSHTCSHRPLVDVDDAHAVADLSRSRRTLEDALGVAVDSFAYPYGAVDGRAKALVRRSGYHQAFAVNSGPLDLERDPLEIRRVLVGDSASDPYMFSKVAGVEKTLRAYQTSLRAHVA